MLMFTSPSPASFLLLSLPPSSTHWHRDFAASRNCITALLLLPILVLLRQIHTVLLLILFTPATSFVHYCIKPTHRCPHTQLPPSRQLRRIQVQEQSAARMADYTTMDQSTSVPSNFANHPIGSQTQIGPVSAAKPHSLSLS